jgi:molybdopterin-containing oxidoreductase family membrane subunit
MEQSPARCALQVSGPPPELDRVLLVANARPLGWISDKVAGIVENPTPAWWWWAFTPSALMFLLLAGVVTYLISTGVGVWGLNHPVMWGWAIVNFVWWIGIGHAGTLISAILFLLRQRWRTSINRAAEAMTIFAVMCAALFPAIHLGRVWYAWWLFPLPNANSIWPQFRSPLMWDVFAVSTYFTVSVLFWYIGLVPDLAILRDRARTKLRHIIYGALALGWTGSNRHWSNYEKAYLILAGLATPLVLSVHSTVSLDFSVSQLPGWHTTIFPPYFVAGAIYSGFGMVLTLVLPLRKLLKLEELITPRHIDVMCKVTLVTGSIVGYAYAMEYFIAWYSGNPYERWTFWHRLFGTYWYGGWAMLLFNVLTPQVFWFKRARRNLLLVFVVSILVNVGMWFERFMIVVGSLYQDFVPGNWGYYKPTWVDVCTYVGTFGLFLTFFLLFVRFLPFVAASEVKGVTPQANPHHPLGGAKTAGGEEGRREKAEGSPSQSVSPLLAPPPSSPTIPSHPPQPYAVLAQFNTSADILHAAQKVRDAGFTRWDVFTPFPLHGLDKAMGLRTSRVGWFAFLGGATGYTFGMLMIWYMNAFDYPIVVGGKPMFSPFYPFVPCFELTILLGSFGAALGMLFLNRLPRLHHPLLKHRRFAQVTHDKFYLVIETSDPSFSQTATPSLLRAAGSQVIELVEE